METTEAGYRPGDRVEWNPTGDTWEPATVQRVDTCGELIALIALGENGQTLWVSPGNLRPLDDAGDPVGWLTTAGSGELQCETVASVRADRDRLAAELAELHTWRGLMSLLDEHWPADVFDGRSNDGDSGPRIVALMREIDLLRGALAAVLGTLAAVRDGGRDE